MLRLYREGELSLEEIGERYDLTRERIRQIVAAAGEPPRSRGAVARRKARKREQEQRERLTEDILRLREQMGNGRVAKQLGVSAELVRKVVQDHLNKYELRILHHGQGKRYEEGFMFDCLRRAAVEAGNPEGPISTNEYDRIARRHGGWPTHQTFLLRWGRWGDACERAGLKTRNRGGGWRVDRISREACLDAVRFVRNEIGEIPGAQRYDREARKRPALPSMATVRNRCGGWRNVTRELMGEEIGGGNGD